MAKVVSKTKNVKRKCEFCRMQILLVAATKSEISLPGSVTKQLDLLITGVGVPSTIYHLQKKLFEKKYDAVIQAGIAGSFNNNINLGDVVLVKKDLFADIGMEEQNVFTSIYDTPFVDKNEFPYNNGWLLNNGNILDQFDLKKIAAITVNKVSDSQLQQQQFISNFNPDIETMEGAAFHFVCLQENIPFIQVRSVSNKVGVRDKKEWKIKEAIVNLGESLAVIIEQIFKN